MNDTIQTIPLANLALAFLPVALVAIIIWKWSLNLPNTIYAVLRMLAQLLLIGYLLIFIVDSADPSDVSVEDLLFVVVLDLHDFIFKMKIPASPGQAVRPRVK